MKVDVRFKVLPRGTPIPADHAYPIFSAVSRILPAIHGEEDIGVFPISGIQTGDRMVTITEDSRLAFRLDSNRVRNLFPLAGKSLGLGRTFLQIGVPTVHALAPVATLRSRLVTIKGFFDPEEFVAAARRQLDALEVSSDVVIKVSKPRTLEIHKCSVVGFEVFLDNLNATDSIRVQEAGIGGRRKMGCGLFVPTNYVGPEVPLAVSGKGV
ncbi:MAG: type I-MYXAN CRISPR-associated protein Cas6/Cmx6 [Planctomycetia bacterium]|nr:type I-MYXAN CRISPR-associated protein Cas6/Cmx6 [Planctomycetia bacterium]